MANFAVAAGMLLVGWGWRHLYAAQRAGSLATDGPYRYVRHPQYVGFVAVTVGFLVMWPTLPTLLLFPFLLVVYGRLARREEAEMRTASGPPGRPTPTPRHRSFRACGAHLGTP